MGVLQGRHNARWMLRTVDVAIHVIDLLWLGNTRLHKWLRPSDAKLMDGGSCWLAGTTPALCRTFVRLGRVMPLIFDWG